VTTLMKKCRAALYAFVADTEGVILPYVTIMLTVIVGTAVLAVDGARFMSLQSQMQKAADSLALAGAAELDQLSSSITRATGAINNIVTNGTPNGLGSQNVQVTQIRFLGSLPASDADAITSTEVLCTSPTCSAADARAARYVEVTAQPVTLTAVLARFFGTNSVTTGASAVAGRGQEVVCGVPPVFICNPYETAGMTNNEATEALLTAVATPAMGRKQIRMNASKTGPGQFGWLVPPDNCTGASCLGNWIGLTHPVACYKRTVSLNTGEKTSANAGFNVRFDLYEGGSPLNAPSSDYAPGTNVRKGFEPKSSGGGNRWCQPTPAAAYYTNTTIRGLPLDSNLNSDTTATMGNGDWNCADYWDINHKRAGGAYTFARPSGCTANATISRYEVYRTEIANDLLGKASGDDWSGDHVQNLDGHFGGGEAGGPYCAAGSGVSGVDVTTGDTDRRLIFAALVNCLANGPFPSGANATNVPTLGFGKFFMTQPVGADGDPTRPLYVEFVGLASLDDGVTQLIPVQLYR
jgi:hypothetical protein